MGTSSNSQSALSNSIFGPPWKTLSDVPKPVLIGAVSAAIWWAGNSFGPWYESSLFQYIAMCYTPLALWTAVSTLLSIQEYSALYREKNEKNKNDSTLWEPTAEERGKITAKVNWTAFLIAISVFVSHLCSRIFYAQSMHENDGEMMDNWWGPEVAGDPLSFHFGMAATAAIGFALSFLVFFVWSKRYRDSDFNTADKYWAFFIGLWVGAGLYMAHLFPGLNEDLEWEIPKGAATLIAGLLNYFVMWGGFSLRPSLVGDGEPIFQSKSMTYASPASSSSSSAPNDTDSDSNSSIESVEGTPLTRRDP